MKDTKNNFLATGYNVNVQYYEYYLYNSVQYICRNQILITVSVSIKPEYLSRTKVACAYFA